MDRKETLCGLDLRALDTDGLLWTRQWTVWSDEGRGISWLEKGLSFPLVGKCRRFGSEEKLLWTALNLPGLACSLFTKTNFRVIPITLFHSAVYKLLLWAMFINATAVMKFHGSESPFYFVFFSFVFRLRPCRVLPRFDGTYSSQGTGVWARGRRESVSEGKNDATKGTREFTVVRAQTKRNYCLRSLILFQPRCSTQST